MKKLLCVSGLIAGLGMSINVMASPIFPPVPKQHLIINNHTNTDITSEIAGNCASDPKMLGEKGITRKGSSSDITPTQILLACASDLYTDPNKTKCKATIFIGDTCHGTSIGTVNFDTQTGIINANVTDTDYILSPNGFSATLSGGPALAAK